jgi:predicted nucleic acid-binding protein
MLQPGHVIDLYDDAEGTFLKDGAALKKYGSKVEVETPDSLAKLADADFALVILTKTGEKHRKYPVHTPDALALSTHYFEQVGFGLPKEAQTVAATNLTKAHYKFGAAPPADLEKAASKEIVSSLWSEDRAEQVEVRTFEQSTKYAMKKTLCDDSVLEVFPVDTLEMTRESAAEFKKVAYQLPPADRYAAATAISARLEELKAPDSDLVEKYASLVPNPAFMTHIAARQGHLLDPVSKKTLDDLSKIAGALPGTKLAEALEAFDRKSGLAHLWDIQIRNPWDTCYTGKEASVKVGEKVITKTALVALLDSGKMKPFFKASMIDAMKKNPIEIFESLPMPTKETIANLL